MARPPRYNKGIPHDDGRPRCPRCHCLIFQTQEEATANGITLAAENQNHFGYCRHCCPFPLYTYRWGNNPVRAQFKGMACQLVVSAKMNTCLLRFVDGRLLVTSRNAIMRITR